MDKEVICILLALLLFLSVMGFAYYKSDKVYESRKELLKSYEKLAKARIELMKERYAEDTDEVKG